MSYRFYTFDNSSFYFASMHNHTEDNIGEIYCKSWISFHTARPSGWRNLILVLSTVLSEMHQTPFSPKEDTTTSEKPLGKLCIGGWWWKMERTGKSSDTEGDIPPFHEDATSSSAGLIKAE